MAGNTVYVQGSYVDVHDNEVVNLNIDKATVTVDGAEGDCPTAGGQEDAPDDVLVEKLLPIFYNDEGNVRRFLKEITGVPASVVTDVVNRWVGERKISDYGNVRKNALRKILAEAGLYDKSPQNWNRRVR